MEPFKLTIGSPQLIRGLRPYAKVPRDSAYLVECVGGIGHQGSLQTIPSLSSIPSSFTTGSFPYPQIFVFTNFILLAAQTEIFEWIDPVAISKISLLPVGSPWTAVEFNDFIYLSNGQVAVIRQVSDGEFRIDTSLLAVEALLDAHGQVMAGGLNTVINPPLDNEGFGEGFFGTGTFGS